MLTRLVQRLLGTGGRVSQEGWVAIIHEVVTQILIQLK